MLWLVMVMLEERCSCALLGAGLRSSYRLLVAIGPG